MGYWGRVRRDEEDKELTFNRSVADIYEVHERGNALGIYFTGQFAGPLFGPIIGGYLVERWGWRSVFWILFVFGCLLLMLVFFAMEETYREEAVWGKEDYLENKEEKESGDVSEQVTAVEKKSMNPLASLVSCQVIVDDGLSVFRLC